jgi:succinate-semialdehyde dehydrogenase/glutarate-semialdehyde dehydrogenase
VPLFRFSDYDEAVMLANDTEYGLAAYLYTRDLGRAWRLAEELEYGMVGGWGALGGGGKASRCIVGQAG